MQDAGTTELTCGDAVPYRRPAQSINLAIVLTLASLVTLSAAFLIKRSIFRSWRHIDWTDSYPHSFAIGMEILFYCCPVVLLAGVLGIMAVAGFTMGGDHQAWEKLRRQGPYDAAAYWLRRIAANWRVGIPLAVLWLMLTIGGYWHLFWYQPYRPPGT
jgi:hypothetical protein